MLKSQYDFLRTTNASATWMNNNIGNKSVSSNGNDVGGGSGGGGNNNSNNKEEAF